MEIDPEICHGKPCIKGTGIMVDLILEWLEAGKNFEDIMDAYPNLSHKDISAAIGYARKSIEEKGSASIYKI
ncbi:MAG: DUF433 domain-containing protein [Candidatus Lokiarchaeota archaeon]|nr:DUF433 domain-containing protein [Candidatus Lokiarchaeota archaeon]